MAANDTDSPPTCLQPQSVATSSPQATDVNEHLHPKSAATRAPTLVLEETLDAASCAAMRRFHRLARRAPRCSAAIDLRRTRRTGSAAWGTLVKVVRDLARSGHAVTVFASGRLVRLLELTGLARHARVVIG